MKRTNFCTLLVVLCGAGLLAPCVGQNLDLSYSSGSTGVDGPFTVPPFAQAGMMGSMVYDPVREECVYFGGSDGGAQYYGTTWTWDGAEWTLKQPEASPAARRGAAMAFDRVRNEVVLLGGRGADGVLRNDTWVWDGTTWTAKTPANSPGGLEGGCMVWDGARQEVLFYGGGLGETWTWDGTDWLKKEPVGVPSGIDKWGAMAYDAATQKVVLFVDANVYTAGATFTWDGATWTHRLTDGNVASKRAGASMVYFPELGRVLLFGGFYTVGSYPSVNSVWSNASFVWNDAQSVWEPWGAPSSAPTGRAYGVMDYDEARGELVVSHGQAAADTMVLKDDYWFARAGNVYTFDLASNPEGIWNFTTITVPAGVTVVFKRNAANNPVLWLASEDVSIQGVIDVSGAPVFGGPGAFNGGAEAAPGFGPGRGRSQGVDDWTSIHGEVAKHAVSLASATYGTPFAQPLLGGSGGGGGVAGGGYHGGQGGGGGGAIAIASSRDIVLTGSIVAKGGGGVRPIANNAGSGGSGSGGTVRLVADRILATGGSIDTTGGNSYWSGTAEGGRIRLEGYARQVTDANLKGVVSKSVPVAGSILTQVGGRLLFTRVDGESVANPPRGDEVNPDVIFSASGSVDIEVQAVNIPDGTDVTVTIEHSIAGTMELGAVALEQCKAVFTATVPAGSGVMRAYATYDVGGPEGDGLP